MLAGEGLQPRGDIHRQVQVLEPQRRIATFRLEYTLQTLRRRGVDSRLLQPAESGLGVFRRQRDIQQPLAGHQEPVEPMNVLRRVYHSQQFDVIVLEHDGVVAGTPADMATARRRRETEPRIGIACAVEIGDADNGVVDTADRAQIARVFRLFQTHIRTTSL